MVWQSLQERILVVKTFDGHSESYAKTVHHLRDRSWGQNKVPYESTVRRPRHL